VDDKLTFFVAVRKHINF